MERVGGRGAEPLEHDRGVERRHEHAADVRERGRDARLRRACGLAALALGHVARDAVDADRPPVLEHDPAARLERDAAAVLREDLELVGRRTAPGELALQHRARLRARLRRNDLRDVATDDFVTGVARRVETGAVDGRDHAAEIVRVDEVVGVVDEPAIAFFARPKRGVGAPLQRGPRADGAEHEPRHGDAERQQRRRRADGEDEQDARQEPRCVAERRGKGVLERRDAGVDRCDLAPPACQHARVGRGSRELGAEAARDRAEAYDLVVGTPPDVDRLRDVRLAAEAPEHHRHRADVAGMVAAGDEARDDHVGVRPRPLELAASEPVAERNGDERVVAHERVRIAVDRVAERAHRRLLGVRPEPLAADVGPDAGHRAERRRDEDEQASDGQRQECDDQRELAAEPESSEKPLER